MYEAMLQKKKKERVRVIQSNLTKKKISTYLNINITVSSDEILIH
jgi:hypothetical protein